jgi:hypothetical protein
MPLVTIVRDYYYASSALERASYIALNVAALRASKWRGVLASTLCKSCVRPPPLSFAPTPTDQPTNTLPALGLSTCRRPMNASWPIAMPSKMLDWCRLSNCGASWSTTGVKISNTSMRWRRSVDGELPSLLPPSLHDNYIRAHPTCLIIPPPRMTPHCARTHAHARCACVHASASHRPAVSLNFSRCRALSSPTSDGWRAQPIFDRELLSSRLG